MAECGKVKFFNAEKGYGFIARDSGGADVFVHHSVLPPNVVLHEDQAISFDVEDSKRGLRAVNVAVG